MQRRMIINALEPEESRIALLEDNVLQELYIQPTATEQCLGNIYKGRVGNVERSIQAAFVDIGLPKNAFLHVSDVKAGSGENWMPTDSPTMKRRKDDTPIQDLIQKGQEVVVQVIKEPIGNKGPSVTTYLSIPGRSLVMMPGVVHFGVSRKIADEAERDRLRKLLDELPLPKGMGFIVRTAGVNARKADLQRDLRYLTRLWSAVEERIKATQAPALLYQETDLVLRCMRDVFGTDIEEIVIDSEEVCRQVSEFLRLVSPTHRRLVKLYRGAAPIFDHYHIEAEIQRTFHDSVPLRSGGSIVINQAEALVAIDVNSGRYTHEADIEETALRTNLEAAREAARQLRLRDLGGVIVIDFIDMRLEKNRREVEKAMAAELKRDRARSRVLRMSRFGLMQLTRQRVRQGTKFALFDRCPSCAGSGLVRSAQSMVPHVMRLIRLALSRKDIVTVEVACHPEVAERLANTKRQALAHLEEQARANIHVLSRPGFRPGQVEVVGHLKDGKKVNL